ncbi:uncharacterized protein PRCAT00003756001 [Priceomyces carsonii]|uniref:uncharacterized protein n=1 Tax=Priceomyces carsonii TaxID=28549 RepID=UPI002EDB6C8B|nr:unnamed protein product [Priceomyces carsonii]
MASLTPISTYNLSLKPFNPVPAIEDEFPVTIRLTVAAVDPEAVDDKEEPSTLRLLKRSDLFLDDDFDSEDEEDFDEDDEESEEEEAPKDKSKKSKKQEDDLDDEDEDDDDSSEDDEDEDDEDGVSEFVICTLSPKVQFQQTLDLTIRPDEEVYFVVTGSYPIHLTGNYVEHPADDDSDDYDEEYSDEEDNLTPDEDEIIAEQDYDLDDLEDASDIENRIEKLLEEDEKNSKKRVANDEPKKSKKAKKEDKKSVQFSDELEQGPTGSTLVEKKRIRKKSQKRKMKRMIRRATRKLTLTLPKSSQPRPCWEV